MDFSKENEQFSELTIQITKALSKEEKKNYGIFITPNNIISCLYNSLKTYISSECLHDKTANIKHILEPACGTCEIINYCDTIMNNVIIDGVELNKNIYNSIQSLTFNNKVNIYNIDFVTYNPSKKYDLIIGNPPYFVCKKNIVPKQYNDYIHGRPNIFGIFIIHSLFLLRPGGFLAFVIPNSFLNSIYYSKIRNYIKETCTIIKIEDYTLFNDFIDTQQSTIGLILRKNNTNYICQALDCDYSMLLNENYIFTDNSKQLKELFENSTTLDKMGLRVRTGQIVWNEVKNELTNHETNTLLIYNTNITKTNTLEIKTFKNNEKGQYITRDGRTEPVLVVNRGNGNSAYKLNYALIKEGPFLVENHLNEIYSPNKISEVKLLNLYNQIMNSFNNPKTKKFIELFLGNNSLSKTELETIFPIYDI